jgi:hypothetical protein
MVMETVEVNTRILYRLTLVPGDGECAQPFVAISDFTGEPVGAWGISYGLRTFKEWMLLPGDVVDELSKRCAQIVLGDE